MFVYLLIAIDGNGQGEIVMICLTALENERAIAEMVQAFKANNPSWRETKVVMSDKDSSNVLSLEKNSLKQSYTSAYFTLCKVS